MSYNVVILTGPAAALDAVLEDTPGGTGHGMQSKAVTQTHSVGR